MTTTAPATAPAQNTEQVEDGGHVDVLIGTEQGDHEPWTHMMPRADLDGMLGYR